MNDHENSGKDRQQYVYNLTMAAVASQVGCFTLVIVFGALIGGLWIDKTFATRPLFTILLLVASMPVTVFGMFKIVQGATSRIKPVIKKNSQENL